MTEAKGKRTYTPKHNSIRAKLLAHFTAHPNGVISRQEAMEKFGGNDSAIDNAASLLVRDGSIKVLKGPNRTTFYAPANLPAPVLPKAPKQPKREREWASTSYYVPPRPIFTSIFDYASKL